MKTSTKQEQKQANQDSAFLSIKTALLSVSNRKGLLSFAKMLTEQGVMLYATGGTSQWLIDNDIVVSDISKLTHFPNEILGGRVKTLHPLVHGAILADRDNQTHLKELEENSIGTLDLVVVNLYPFADVARDFEHKNNLDTINQSQLASELIENIDIGGVSLLRSAAKNYKHVVVASNPCDYEDIACDLKRHGGISLALRERLSLRAFRQTANYDALIDATLSNVLLKEKVLHLCYTDGKKASLWRKSTTGSLSL